MKWARYSVAGLTLLAVTAAVVALVANPAVVSGQALVSLVLAAVQLAVGAVIAHGRPAHPAGPLLAAAGLAVVIQLLPGSDLDGPLAGSWMLLYLPFAVLVLVLPTGRFLSPRWRAVGIALPIVVAVFVGANAVIWGVPASEGPLTVPALLALPAYFLLLAASLISAGVRYRRADAHERLQLRWIFLAGATLPLTLLLCWTSYLLLQRADLVVVGLLVMYLVIPAATAIAVLRPDWFDVDRVAVATASVGALSIVVLGILSVTAATAGLALVNLSPTVAIIVTAVIAILVVPGYRLARCAFGRLLYPDRARAVAAIRALESRVEAGDAQPESVQEVLRSALRDPGLAVAYRGIADNRLVDAEGSPLQAGALAVTVRLHGEEVGALIASADRAKKPPQEVASVAAPLLQNVRMRSELAAALRDVEASRQRILRAGYEERRRLERDLHDGAQQRLVALGMALRVLQRSHPEEAMSASLDGAVAELGLAVAELRQIAHGVRPSALDDGLGPALANLVRHSPVPVELEVRTDELPDPVCTTAYFVASEAVANAVKHAESERIRVEITQHEGELRVRVSDDGRGGAVMRPTAGLTGLHDRVAAMGGRLQLSSPAGRGTIVEALLPCES